MTGTTPSPGRATPSFWRDRPILVTGATGLLGGWLVRRLLDLEADIVCVMRDWVPQSEILRREHAQRIRIVRGDVRSQPLMERTMGEYEIDVVFHLAAQTVVGVANRNPVSTLDSNIRGTWSVFEACRRSPTVGAVILASSDKAYGDQLTLPYTEETALEGRHPYDVSKSCADLIAQAYAKTYGMPVGITRCGNFYGGGDLNWNRIVPGTIRAVIRGERPVIRSDGSPIRDYFYVEDGAEAYLTLAEAVRTRRELHGEAFNFSNEIQLTVLDLTERILRAMGSNLEPDIRADARSEIAHQWLSAEKARRLLGWTPSFDLDSGLARTIPWYEEYLTTRL